MMQYVIYLLNLAWYLDIVYNVLMYFNQKRIPDVTDFGVIIMLGILLVRIDIENIVGRKR